MYLALVNHYRNFSPYGSDIKPRPPAKEETIMDAEKKIGVSFPQALREMLLEMDGDCDLLFCVEQIIEIHQSIPIRYNGTDKLLVFGGDGAGNFYGYEIHQGKIQDTHIVFYNHETHRVYCDEICKAISLYDFIKKFYEMCYGEDGADG